MRTPLLTAFFMLGFLLNINAKSFDLSIHISSVYGGKDVKGVSVVGIIEKGNVEIKGITDENGTVYFKGLKAKEIHFTATDPSGIYRARMFKVLRKKSGNVSLDISLRFTEEKEKQLVQSKKKVHNSNSADSLEMASECDTTKISLAEYPGGHQAMFSFIVKNLDYPSKAIEDGVMGKVYVQFVIEKDGSVSNIDVIRGLSPEMDEEAIRIVALMPNWIPQKCDGIPVRTKWMLPFNFSME